MKLHWSEVPRVLYILSNQSDVVNQWRIYWPCAELISRGYIADHVGANEFEILLEHLFLGRWNTIVTPRLAFDSPDLQQSWLNMLQELKKQHNINWFLELDDDLI